MSKSHRKKKIINIVKSKAKPFPLQTWGARWERQLGTRYHYLVPEINLSTTKQGNILLKLTSPGMVQKIFWLKCSHNLLPASKFKFNPIENTNCAECGVKYDKFYLLMNRKKLDLYQTNLKAMVNVTLQMHCDKPVTMNKKSLLGETFLLDEVALTVRTFLIDFLTLAKGIAF